MLLFSLGLDLFCAGLILIPVYLLLNRACFHDLTKSALYCIFSLYLVAVNHLVGLPCITYINPGLNLTLVPFADILAYPSNALLNVALFLPLGILLPLLWNQFRIMKNTVLFGFGVSLTIDLLQILVGRATDINDLITNTLGAFLGAVLWKLAPPISLGGYGNHREIYGLCGIVFAVMFFIDPLIFNFFWDLILR